MADNPTNVATELATLIVRPFLTTRDADKILKSSYGLHASAIKLMSSYGDQNFYVRLDMKEAVKADADSTIMGDEFVLKIFDSNDSSKEGFVEMRVKVMLFLSSKGISCSVPVMDNEARYTHLKKLYLDHTADDEGNKASGSRQPFGLFKILLMTYLPGTRLSGVSISSDFLYELGRFSGNVNQCLLEFSPIPTLFRQQSSEYTFSLDNLLQAKLYLDDLPPSKVPQVQHIVDEFERCVVPMRSRLRKSMIHGDITPSNLIIRPNATPDESPKLQGIIDFGDAVYSHLIYDIATALASIMECKCNVEAIEATGHFLAGYQSILPLDDIEKQLLYICILSRFAQVQLLCIHDIKTRPKNAHIEEGLEERWERLDKLCGVGDGKVKEMWQKIALAYENTEERSSKKK